MNCKRFALSTIAGFIFAFAFEFLFHGKLLKPIYESTAHLWRTETEMQGYCGIAMGGLFLLVTALGYIFTRHYEGKGIGEGIRFGLMFGILLGVAQFSMYAYMPIPMTLALAWFGGALVEMVGVGIIFSLIYKK